MVPKVLQDAGYTAVGLGVLAVQQVQVQRREARARLEAGVGEVRSTLTTALCTAQKATATGWERLSGLRPGA